MANTDNQCKDLNIPNEYDNHENHLEIMLNMQKDLQDHLFERNGTKKFEEMTLDDLAKFWLLNEHALVDELHESIDALGGIKDGIGSAAWKTWKAKNKEAKDVTVKDLSQDDLTELKFEIIDAWHFLMNYWVSIGGTPQEFFNYYHSKNKENFSRQERNY